MSPLGAAMIVVTMASVPDNSIREWAPSSPKSVGPLRALEARHPDEI
jgi:hypothetical protein